MHSQKRVHFYLWNNFLFQNITKYNAIFNMSLHRRFGADGWRFYPFRLQRYRKICKYARVFAFFLLFPRISRINTDNRVSVKTERWKG